ncbi:CoA ester lyase [Sphingomonas sp. HF-S4]|uniref:CoA ester lyase n=1 Tax=Sphingomonas agrestis TaxID=3080540 RepID=A0ABU3Y4T7_9SPHN|nr:CoA ester lyase [Sphingomonas sp. HF-S4]MDV3456411.1 CoA ester lyase [Sphingomonas sp. HF-S4]
MTTARLAPRTALFLPASNPRAVAKARGLDTDMIILDLEDAVRDDAKAEARAAAVAAMAEGFGERLTAIRINGVESREHAADLAAAAVAKCDFIVVPKVEDAGNAAAIAEAIGKPLLAMIETPRGVLEAVRIAAVPGVGGLLAGANDLRAALGIPTGREGLTLSLQAIVLAARAHDIWALDGVFNALDDAEGLAAECRHGRALGFDGKSLIHPNQIQVATQAFGPSEAELADAHALVAAATGGAERFEGRMIEAMHVAQARALIERQGL